MDEEDDHENSMDENEDSNHSSSNSQDENDSNDESDAKSEDDSESDTEDRNTAPWNLLISQAYKGYRNEYRELVEHFQGEGDSKEHAQSKAHNSLLKKYRKALREHLVDQLLYFRRLRKTPIYQKIMETKKQFKDLDYFDEEEALRSAVKKREFLLNRLIEPMHIIHSDESDEEEAEEEILLNEDDSPE